MAQMVEISGSPDADSQDDLKTPSQQSHNHDHHKHNHISPKFKQLTRSAALCEDSASPPLDPLQSTASTCSTDSNSSGIGSKSQTSGSSWSYRGRLEKEGSQSSEAGTSSSLSRDSSLDTPYKDSTGIDLEDFIKKTLNKTPKDRSMLIKLEVDLVRFIREPKHHYLKFPQMSSYDRMLVHRIAAFFGLDHNVDQTGKCVIVNKTQNTRIPDFSFQDHIHSGELGKPKMLLKRGGAVGGSFEELHSKSLQKPSLDSTRAKSLEERQQLYDEVRQRIFTGEESQQPTGYAQEDLAAVTGIVRKLDRPHSFGSSRDDHTWSSTESSGYGTDGSSKPRIIIPKANSFGGTGTFIYQHLKSPMRGGSLSKADSMSMGGAQASLGSPLTHPMLVSQSPTCSQSDNSSVGSNSSGIASSPHQPPSAAASVAGQGQKFYWVASDLGSIPPGSVVINPQTGQPYYNSDGTQYRHTPGQLVPSPSPGPYPQSPQPTVYHIQQAQPEWTSQLSQESQSSTDMCQQVSMLRITPQSSTDSAPGDGQPTGQPPVIVNQAGLPQQYGQSQPVVPGAQQIYYPAAAQGMAGQPVRYVCSMAYPSPSPTSANLPQGMGPGVVVEGQPPTQQYQSQPYQQTQYIQGYPGNQVYQATAQVQGQVQHIQGSEVNYSQAQQGSVPCSGDVSGVSPASIGYTYPVQYNNQGTYSTPNQSQIYYAVQAQSGPPQAGAQVGYAYQGQPAAPAAVYSSGSPPSQSASVSNSNQPVTTINIPQQPVAAAGSNIQQQQPAAGGGATITPGPAPTPSTQFISYPSYPHQPQPAHTMYPPSYPGPAIRGTVPAVVPFPSVQTQVQAPAQTYQTVYRPNMQYPMQLQQSQPGMAAAAPQQNSANVNPVSANVNSACVNGTHNPSQHHVTVSAKGIQYENGGTTAENGGDKLETVSVTAAPTTGPQQQMSAPQPMAAPVATTTVFRPPRQVSIGDPCMVGHPQFRPQVHPVQFTPAVPSQPPRFPSPKSPTQKAQRIKASLSQESQNSQQSTDAGPMKSSSILEVYDLPRHLRRSDADKLLSDVLSMGANVQYVTKELEANQGDFNTNNLTMSQYASVFAVFPDSAVASHMLQTYSNNQFKLRLVTDSIGAGEV